MNIGARVKMARKRAQLSQDALARRAGMSVSAVAQIEQGGRNDPHYSTLVKLADAFGVSISELVGESAPLVEAPPEIPSAEAGASEYLARVDAMIAGWEAEAEAKISHLEDDPGRFHDWRQQVITIGRLHIMGAVSALEAATDSRLEAAARASGILARWSDLWETLRRGQEEISRRSGALSEEDIARFYEDYDRAQRIGAGR